MVDVDLNFEWLKIICLWIILLFSTNWLVFKYGNFKKIKFILKNFVILDYTLNMFSIFSVYPLTTTNWLGW